MQGAGERVGNQNEKRLVQREAVRKVPRKSDGPPDQNGALLLLFI